MTKGSFRKPFEYLQPPQMLSSSGLEPPRIPEYSLCSSVLPMQLRYERRPSAGKNIRIEKFLAANAGTIVNGPSGRCVSEQSNIHPGSVGVRRRLPAISCKPLAETCRLSGFCVLPGHELYSIVYVGGLVWHEFGGPCSAPSRRYNLGHQKKLPPSRWRGMHHPTPVLFSGELGLPKGSLGPWRFPL